MLFRRRKTGTACDWLLLFAALTASIAAATPPAPATPPTPASSPALTWDAPEKRLTAEPGAERIAVSYRMTNCGAQPVTIHAVNPSCGCTSVEGLALPLTIAPGASGQLDFSVDLVGKRGTLNKTITVESSAGRTELSVAITIPENLSAERKERMALAHGDRQAVFKNDCAACHVAPTVGKTGAELYNVACGICHDAEHRASMVPSLGALVQRSTAAYWEQWIRQGKEGTLMPAFAQSAGGPLDDAQIRSLIDFLAERPPAELEPEKKK